ncbi:MAG: tRNA uridine-5-carboxymethylaminomethyl(34) synthesis GTPase MnmE [Amaricoccus sp.]|uniref:tRNA uridine-5-carboxymethylaminomethyl(34) synthesis GTPase MnmE n=1 Tax=Amaricoccus sp. TaxID=1872485 RepID=UPI003315A006
MLDTIFAQASAPGRSAVAIIRISGVSAFAALELLAGARPPDRLASVRWIRDPRDGSRIDQALILCFPGPGSFTGEDVVELQTHGSPAVVRALLGALAQLPNLRAAEPGEFTRRALMNARLDLAQVEGLGDLLAAETAAQMRQATTLMSGVFSRRAGGWRDALVGAMALVEASIDFSDEDLPDDLLEPAEAMLRDVLRDLRAELNGTGAAKRLREGFEVALVGAPNVGKSTLLNAIAGRDVAITSERAGTTRDVLEVRLDLGGLPVTMLDMAGMRAADDEIERIGVDRAVGRATMADMRIFLVEKGGSIPLGVERVPGDLVLRAKADLDDVRGDGVSGLTGAGVSDLLDRVAEELGRRAEGASSTSHIRQEGAIEAAATAIEAAMARLGGSEVDFLAEDLRSALRSLDFLVGRVDVEAILDVIFRDFCLGK